MKMKTKIIISAILACSVMGSAIAAPQAQWVTGIQNNKSTLINKAVSTPSVNNSHDAVSYSYKLDANEELEFNSKAFVVNSRQYWLDSTSDKLAKGISLPVSGGETIIRISPLSNNKAIQLTASSIEIQNNGVSKSIQVFADSENLKSTGAAFSDQSIALKVNASVGNLNLKVTTASANIPFVIHVFEPKSKHVLSLSSTQATYNANQSIQINTNFLLGKESINASLQGYINRPDGSVLGELKFSRNSNGSYSAQIDATGAQGLAQGLWQVHIFAKSQQKGLEIMRDAQTSFAVNLNTAQFSSDLKLVNNTLQVGLNVGLAGRYEVRGVLMGTDVNSKQLRPIAMTMSANWLEAGIQSISLPLDAKILAETHLKAPYVIKDVRLSNQTYLAPVQTVESGIRIVEIK